MTSLIKKILTLISGRKQAADLFEGYIAKNSVLLFLLHCTALVLGFLTNYIFIKLAGVDIYGSYVYVFNMIYLFAGFCLLGTDTLLVKKTAVYNAELKYGEQKGVFFFSLLLVICASLIITALAQLFFSITNITGGKTPVNWVLFGIVSLVMLSVTAVNQAYLQGLKKIVLGQVTEKVIRPLLMIILVLVFFYFRKTPGLEELIWLNVVAIGVGMVITSALLRKSIAFEIRSARPKYQAGGWLTTSVSFFLISILYILNARIDIFLLGLYRPENEVGIYNIALRISEVVSFGLVIINFVIAPLIAGLFSNGKKDDLQKIVTRSSKAVLFTGLPLAVIIVIFRHQVLSFFEVDFLKGHEALLILCLGQLINIFFGSVGLLLTMTGYQKYSIISLAAGTVLNVCLNIILIPGYGLVGTAIATSASLVLWNCLMYLFVRRKLNIRPTAFGVI